jgi:creatinine amidohydrolase
MRAKSPAKSLSVQWEELTASDFPGAVERAKRVCVLPIGVIEKHGPHLPLGTDVMAARAAAIGAAQREYAVVFPHYYFGQIYEARHQPGCVTIPPELLSQLLQAVCETIARNGFEKILIVNGHGGNNDWLPFFCLTQLSSPRDYAVYIARPEPDPKLSEQVRKLRKTNWGGHACEGETAGMLAIRPDLVQLEKAASESGLPQKRLAGLPFHTAMFWYADFPNHFAGDPAAATAELGKLQLESHIRGLVKVYQAVKKDTTTRKLQAEFYARSAQPLKTKMDRGRSSR